MPSTPCPTLFLGAVRLDCPDPPPPSRANCDSYGPTAWWWETEELVRKLLLTGLAVLMDAGSPLQVCSAEGPSLARTHHSRAPIVTTLPRVCPHVVPAAALCAHPWLAAMREQVTAALVVCSWAHVRHAVYTPWGVRSQTYYVQHLALFVTSFVFLMGLLFKVRARTRCEGPCTSAGGEGGRRWLEWFTPSPSC